MHLKKIFIFILLLTSLHSAEAYQLAGITDISVNSPRTGGFSILLEKHLSNVLDSTEAFELVNSGILRRELTKYGCVDEKCVLRFARKAGISMIVRGDFDDKGDSIVLKLSSFGVDVPYQGRLIYQYRVEIPMSGPSSTRKFSYICEEHSGRFVSELMKKFKQPLFIKAVKSGDTEATQFRLDTDKKISGEYRVYRFNKSPVKSQLRIYSGIADAKITNSLLDSGEFKPEEGDFVFHIYKSKSDFLDEYYHGRKKEIVFTQPSVADSLYKVLFTVPASVTMPIASPLMGYYRNSDWEGLTLWAINAVPWITIEYYGLLNDPDDLRSGNRNISKDDKTINRFAWYMFFTGGMSLFVDAFSHRYLRDASDYKGTQPLMGNSMSAAYLSLVSGGGGHFYRGYRGWGYFYFHLNNILLYLTIREFSPPERYESGSYNREGINKKMAYSLAGIFSVVKIVEMVHAVMLRDSIRNGEVIDELYSYEPFTLIDYNDGIKYGLRCVYRF